MNATTIPLGACTVTGLKLDVEEGSVTTALKLEGFFTAELADDLLCRDSFYDQEGKPRERFAKSTLVNEYKDWALSLNGDGASLDVQCYSIGKVSVKRAESGVMTYSLEAHFLGHHAEAVEFFVATLGAALSATMTDVQGALFVQAKPVVKGKPKTTSRDSAHLQ